MTMPAHEAIRNLKARYFRYLDTRRWQDLRSLLADDFIGDFGSTSDQLYVSPEAFVENLQSQFKDATTVHHGHMPEIKLQGEDRATAYWAMEDIIHTPEFEQHGFGYHDDEYRRVGDEWLISRTSLTRLKLDLTPL